MELRTQILFAETLKASNIYNHYLPSATLRYNAANSEESLAQRRVKSLREGLFAMNRLVFKPDGVIKASREDMTTAKRTDYLNRHPFVWHDKLSSPLAGYRC